MANDKAPRTIREMYFYIGKVVASINAKIENFESVQRELTEHKLNHWKVIFIMIGITTINITVFIFIIKYFSSKG